MVAVFIIRTTTHNKDCDYDHSLFYEECDSSRSPYYEDSYSQ